MRLNSLSLRLFASAAVWSLIVLPIAGFSLSSLFRDSIERGFDARLNLYMTTLIARTTFADGGRIVEPPAIGETVFTLPFSGWYWQIKGLDGQAAIVASSESLADEILPLLRDQGVTSNEDLVWQAFVEGPKQQSLKVLEREITFDDGAAAVRYSFLIAGNSEEIEDEISDFTATLVFTLSLLGIGLVVATYFQVRFGLAPLRIIGDGLAAIRSGKSEKLRGEFPVEIEPLQTELNALLNSNREIIERARMHVGNLAHALKTPLSVIQNEAKGGNSALSSKVLEQTTVMKDQITHHLDRAQMAARVNLVGSVTDVAPVLSSLTRALKRIYQDKNVEISVTCSDGAKFRGERQDFEEMVGNLLDNSCKWARSKVVVTVLNGTSSGKDMFDVLIEDDGPGLSEEDRKLVVKRGQRLDESVPGSGLGLSIVVELAYLYKGEFVLEDAKLGGLAARLSLPAAV